MNSIAFQKFVQEVRYFELVPRQGEAAHRWIHQILVDTVGYNLDRKNLARVYRTLRNEQRNSL